MDRYRAKTLKPPKAPAKFKNGHKKHAGREPGVPNKITRTLKEVILEALTLYGKDGKGKEGMVGYFLSMCEDKLLMCRLVEKILPMQINSKHETTQVLHIPPESLKGLDKYELQALEKTLAKVGSGMLNADVEVRLPAPEEPNEYAELIGVDDSGVRH